MLGSLFRRRIAHEHAVIDRALLQRLDAPVHEEHDRVAVVANLAKLLVNDTLTEMTEIDGRIAMPELGLIDEPAVVGDAVPLRKPRSIEERTRRETDRVARIGQPTH